MRINNRRGYTWKAWLLLVPLLCSTLVSISRTMDYRHHATDVIAGAIVGIATSWFSYRQYYPVRPSLTSYTQGPANDSARLLSAIVQALLPSHSPPRCREELASATQQASPV
jgi:diacylglycerol diphosphate phosphatase/phosphatidate phosphatase